MYNDCSCGEHVFPSGFGDHMASDYACGFIDHRCRIQLKSGKDLIVGRVNGIVANDCSTNIFLVLHIYNTDTEGVTIRKGLIDSG